MSAFYTAGQPDIYALLGLQKHAAKTRLLQSIGKRLPSLGGVKRFLTGQPRQFMHEARTGRLWAPGSTLRQGLAAPGMLSKGLLYGLPAAEAVNIAARGEPGQRAERIGGLVGGTLGGLAAWGPGGMLGSMAVGSLGARIGTGLARTGKYTAGMTPRAEDVRRHVYGGGRY